MELNVTNEEIEALKNFISKKYEAINQMLVSNSETDIALLSDEVENKVVDISYNREDIEEYLNSIKLIYSLILKQFYKSNPKVNQVYRGTNIAEIERLKNEPYVDRFLVATTSRDDADKKYASKWNRPASMNIKLSNNVPYIFIKDFIGRSSKNDILIAPFTKIISIKDNEETEVDGSNKKVRNYDVEIEKQELEELKENERKGLYSFILENCYTIHRKIEECILLEKDNASNFENVRKLEQLIANKEAEVEEKEIAGSYTDKDREDDIDDVKRINRELKQLKELSTSIFEERKEKINFINVWKRNIAVYMMAECRQIENDFSEYTNREETEKLEKNKNKSKESKTEEVMKEITEKVEAAQERIAEKAKEVTEEFETEKTPEEIEKEKVLEQINAENPYESEEAETEKEEERDLDELQETQEPETKKDDVVEDKVIKLSPKAEATKDDDESRYKEESKQNIKLADELINNINRLITKQQNHAKIAGTIGSNYSALNNAFEMRDIAEKLKESLVTIDLKVSSLCSDNKKGKNDEELERISKANIQINTLFNYLNNPKIAIGNAKVSRFDEIAIIEENELKRGIAEKVRNILAEAELKKLKDDREIIEEKSPFMRFIGFFTGRNKYDEFLLEQIEVRSRAIRTTMSKKMSLARNYSIHEIMALSQMFIDENEDDELIEDDVASIESLTEELRRNYVISDSKVYAIIQEKERNELPIEDKKISKREMKEIETLRFLHKYGYDGLDQANVPDPKYQDTMAKEIVRISDYIHAARII